MATHKVEGILTGEDCGRNISDERLQWNIKFLTIQSGEADSIFSTMLQNSMHLIEGIFKVKADSKYIGENLSGFYTKRLMVLEIRKISKKLVNKISPFLIKLKIHNCLEFPYNVERTIGHPLISAPISTQIRRQSRKKR